MKSRSCWILPSAIVTLAACSSTFGSGERQDASVDGSTGDASEDSIIVVEPQDSSPVDAHDAGAGAHDSAVPIDAQDATMPNAPDASPPVDAPPDAPPVPVACSVNPGSVFMIDDLSVNTANGREFQQALWLAPLPGSNDSMFVLTQAQGEGTDVSVYEVSFGQSSSTRVSMGSAASNVHLIDVEPGQGGYAALTTLGTSVPGESALQVFGPLNSFGTTPVPKIISPTVLDGGTFPNGASFTSPQAGLYEWIMAAKNPTTSTTEIVSGSSANGGTFENLTSQGTENAAGPLFDLNGDLYDFAPDIGDAGILTELVYPDTLANAGTRIPISTDVPNAAYIGVLTSHVSVTDPTKAAVLAFTADTSGNGQFWAGKLSPTQLQSPILGAPVFTAGSPFGISEVPFNVGSGAAAGDQAFVVGPPQGGGGQVLLLWIGAEGRVISSGPLINRPNLIQLTAVAVVATGSLIGEVDAPLFVAWTERIVPDTASPYDQLWGAEVTCKPAADAD